MAFDSHLVYRILFDIPRSIRRFWQYRCGPGRRRVLSGLSRQTHVVARGELRSVSFARHSWEVSHGFRFTSDIQASTTSEPPTTVQVQPSTSPCCVRALSRLIASLQRTRQELRSVSFVCHRAKASHGFRFTLDIQVSTTLEPPILAVQVRYKLRSAAHCPGVWGGDTRTHSRTREHFCALAHSGTD